MASSPLPLVMYDASSAVEAREVALQDYIQMRTREIINNINLHINLHHEGLSSAGTPEGIQKQLTALLKLFGQLIFEINGFLPLGIEGILIFRAIAAKLNPLLEETIRQNEKILFVEVWKANPELEKFCNVVSHFSMAFMRLLTTYAPGETSPSGLRLLMDRASPIDMDSVALVPSAALLTHADAVRSAISGLLLVDSPEVPVEDLKAVWESLIKLYNLAVGCIDKFSTGRLVPELLGTSQELKEHLAYQNIPEAFFREALRSHLYQEFSQIRSLTANMTTSTSNFEKDSRAWVTNIEQLLAFVKILDSRAQIIALDEIQFAILDNVLTIAARPLNARSANSVEIKMQTLAIDVLNLLALSSRNAFASMIVDKRIDQIRNKTQPASLRFAASVQALCAKWIEKGPPHDLMAYIAGSERSIAEARDRISLSRASLISVSEESLALVGGGSGEDSPRYPVGELMMVRKGFSELLDGVKLARDFGALNHYLTQILAKVDALTKPIFDEGKLVYALEWLVEKGIIEAIANGIKAETALMGQFTGAGLRERSDVLVEIGKMHCENIHALIKMLSAFCCVELGVERIAGLPDLIKVLEDHSRLSGAPKVCSRMLLLAKFYLEPPDSMGTRVLEIDIARSVLSQTVRLALADAPRTPAKAKPTSDGLVETPSPPHHRPNPWDAVRAPFEDGMPFRVEAVDPLERSPSPGSAQAPFRDAMSGKPVAEPRGPAGSWY